MMVNEKCVTRPRPFSFTERDESKQKTLMRIKVEQQLALKQAEEEAARRVRTFRANPIPQSTLEPRFQKILVDQAIRRRDAHEHNVEVRTFFLRFIILVDSTPGAARKLLQACII